MNPGDYTLQHTDIPQPHLLDADPVTEQWPLPPARAWDSAPLVSEEKRPILARWLAALKRVTT